MVCTDPKQLPDRRFCRDRPRMCRSCPRGLLRFLHCRCQNRAQDTAARPHRAQKAHAGGAVETGTEQKRDAHSQIAGHNGAAGSSLLLLPGVVGRKQHHKRNPGRRSTAGNHIANQKASAVRQQKPHRTSSRAQGTPQNHDGFMVSRTVCHDPNRQPQDHLHHAIGAHYGSDGAGRNACSCQIWCLIWDMDVNSKPESCNCQQQNSFLFLAHDPSLPSFKDSPSSQTAAKTDQFSIFFRIQQTEAPCNQNEPQTFLLAVLRSACIVFALYRDKRKSPASAGLFNMQTLCFTHRELSAYSNSKVPGISSSFP